MSEEIILSRDLDGDIDLYLMQGYRIDMIMPSDAPREVLLSKGHDSVLLRSKNRIHSSNSDWATGRAGMEYRDLVPGRLGGKLIASHIRLNVEGEVPDYVHYHKAGFQTIYCWRGKVKVVYEDQGPPFWLSPGDCVLQPPEIRHRVLECTAGAEVIELSSPAEHETWVEHDIKLPTGEIKPDRDFGGQRFVRHIAADSTAVRGDFGGFDVINTGIATASGGAARVFELRTTNDAATFDAGEENPHNTFYFVLSGPVNLAIENFDAQKFTPGDSILIPPLTRYRLEAPANSAILCVEI